MTSAAEAYENDIVPALFAPWSAHLIRRAAPQPQEQVLDVACGTGIMARQTAARIGPRGKVIGLDLEPGMLGQARLAAGRAGLVIQWCAGRAEQLPFSPGRFDLILCQFGLMLFADRRAGLAEMRRVLKVGGRIALSVWQGLDRHPLYRAIHAVSQRRLGVSAVQHVFSMGDPDELRDLLDEAGYRQVRIEPVSMVARIGNAAAFLDWEIGVDPASAPALRDLDAQARQVVMDAARQDLRAVLLQFRQHDQVVLPFHAHIAQARR